jgi:membrane protein YqaA with SNARE-associated domain
MHGETSSRAPRRRSERIRGLLQAFGVLLLALMLNLLILYLPRNWFEGWGTLGYFGVFIVTALANASVFIPVPYPGLIARLATDLNVYGVAFLGAAGSAVGESTAYLVGRAGKSVVEQNRFYLWLQRQLRTPRRAFLILFVLSAPPNPFFDVAGLTAGSVGVPYPLFVAATFSGRIIRMLILANLGRTFL